MTAWIVGAVGVLVAMLAGAVAAAAANVRRVDLYRWVVERRPGAGAAGAILDAPWRVDRAAHALVALGVLLAAVGLGSTIRYLPIALAATAVLLLLVPGMLLATYALSRAVGRRWPDRTVAAGVPWLEWFAAGVAPLLPEPAERPRRGDTTVLSGETSEARQLDVLSGVLAFSERPVREVMTPRTDVVAVREGASVEDIARLIADAGYSRIPVYRDSLDNVIGMVYAFDLLKLHAGAELPVRPVVTAPESKRSADLLFEMQRQRRQFAVVLDEYGGTAGIVTLEDLLEELVGEIFDEYDGTAVGENAGLVLLEATGTTPLEDIEVRFGVRFGASVETVGGLLLRAAGRIPSAGERLAIHGVEFDVLAATPNRVERVLVRLVGTPVLPLSVEGSS